MIQTMANKNMYNKPAKYPSWIEDLELEKKAEALVKKRIIGTRKGLPNEQNYMHSFRVRDIVMGSRHRDDIDYDLFIAALLHDVVEDGGVKFSELKKMGFSDRTIKLVRLCTHRMDVKNSTERWLLMMARLIEAKDDDAWRIKLADLTDNLSQSKGLSPENRQFMIEVKAPILLRLANVSHSAYSKLRDEMEKQKEELKNNQKQSKVEIKIHQQTIFDNFKKVSQLKITPNALKLFESLPEQIKKVIKKEILLDINSGRLTIPAAKEKFMKKLALALS